MKFLAEAGCLLFCFTLAGCSVYELFAGSISPSTEGRALIGTVLPRGRLLLQICFWILSAAECFKDLRRGLPCIVLCALHSFLKLPLPLFYLIQMCLLCLLSNFSTVRRNIVSWLAAHALFFLVLLVLLHRGVVTDVLMSSDKTSLPLGDGHSFGMIHPNSIGVMLLSCSLACWLLWRPQRWWLSLIAFLAVAYFTLWVSLSRTSAFLLAAFPFLSFAVLWIEKKLRNDQSKTLYAAAVPFCMLILTLILGYVSPDGGHSSNFWWRFQDIHVFQDYGITLFGIGTLTGPWYYLDNIYLYLLVYIGVVPFLLYLLLYSLMQVHLIKTGRIEMLAVSILFLIYGLMEHVGIYSTFFIVPLIAFAPERPEPFRPRLPAAEGSAAPDTPA